MSECFVRQETKQFERAMARLDGQVEEIINARREAEAEVHGTEELPQDLLDFFLKNEQNQQAAASVGSRNGDAGEEKLQKTALLRRQVIVDNIKTSLFPAHDTTASAISWALYLISKQ